MIGHLTMSQSWTLSSPSPTTSPIDWASGPETMSISSTKATSSTAIRVISSMSGRSFQNGRPSPIS